MLIILSSIAIFDYLGLSNSVYTIKENIMIFAFSGSNFFGLMVAIGMFVVFKNMKISFNKFINTIATTTFAIYLIHDNQLIKDWLWNDVIRGYNFFHSDFLLLHMLVSSIGIFLVCSIMEFLRIRYVEKPIMEKIK